MASPFRIFRKYMKTLLVVFGVMLMFVFVIGDALVGYLGGSPSGGGEGGYDARAVAVRWDDGRLTNAQLDALRRRRSIVNDFIQQVEFIGREEAFRAGIEPSPLRVQPILGPDTPERGVERSVVQTRLFADAARRAGMHVTDATIVQYLDELGRGNVSREQMRTILNMLQQRGVPATIDYVFDALREEMLARNYIASHQYAWETVTPQQRWEDWLSVNDRVVIEAAALPAESFLAEVPEPTEAELTKFFEEHKNRLPQPDMVGEMEFPSATPGFQIPRTIDVQYIEADYDERLAKLENEVTEDQIAKYYEENKELFIKAETGLIDAEDALQEAPPTEEDETPVPAPEGTDAAPISEDADSDSLKATDADDEAALEGETDSESESAPEAPATEGTDPQTPDADEAAPEDGDQSSVKSAPGRMFRLAAFQQDEDEKADAAPEAVDADPAAEPAESPADGQSADAPAPATTGSTEPAASSEAGEKPLEYQPLEEVRDRIRRELAGRQAAEQISDLVKEIANELASEYQQYLISGDLDERRPLPPALADASALAVKHGLKHGRTGPVSILELRDLPAGKSGSVETGYPLWHMLYFDREVQLYKPIISVDVDGNRFIVLKMSDTPGRVPKLSEVKDEVVRAWKLQRAADRARERAEELAKEAEQAGLPLSEFLANEPSIEVVRTDPFSQFTGGDVAIVNQQVQQQPFRLSQPDGIVAAGPDFMRRVFELKPGEIAALQNHDHSIAYVVRLVEHLDSPEDLRTAYLSEANMWPGMRMMTNSHAQIGARLLVDDIASSAGLKWERTPDQIEREDEEGEGEGEAG